MKIAFELLKMLSERKFNVIDMIGYGIGMGIYLTGSSFINGIAVFGGFLALSSITESIINVVNKRTKDNA